jgi:hypothetical protein
MSAPRWSVVNGHSAAFFARTPHPRAPQGLHVSGSLRSRRLRAGRIATTDAKQFSILPKVQFAGAAKMW